MVQRVPAAMTNAVMELSKEESALGMVEIILLKYAVMKDVTTM